MKRKLTALKSILIVSAFLLPLNLWAQSDVEGLFKSGPEDATKLLSAYASPAFKGFGIGLNSGWNTSAKTKGFLRFDLRITGTMAFVPTKDRTYDVNTLGLKNISPVNPALSTGPTFSGEDKEGARMQINGALPSSQFNLPQGLGISYVPSPQVQLTVGLPKNIDVSLRLVPEITFGEDKTSVSLFGIGAKVEVLPLIMGKKEKLMPFDLAVAFGLTRLNFHLPLNVNNQANSNQELDLKVNGFSTEAIISKKILFFTPFASVGYNSAKSTLKALGTYEFDVPVTPSTPTGKQSFTDPVSITNKDINGLKASLGFQLNLAFFRLYASYTQAQYSYVNGGIGFGFGK